MDVNNKKAISLLGRILEVECAKLIKKTSGGKWNVMLPYFDQLFADVVANIIIFIHNNNDNKTNYDHQHSNLLSK